MYCSLRPAKVVMLICMLLFRPLRLLLVGVGYLLHSSLGFQLPQLYLTMVRADNGWPDNFLLAKSIVRRNPSVPWITEYNDLGQRERRPAWGTARYRRGGLPDVSPCRLRGE